jgi:hypothetical protein
MYGLSVQVRAGGLELKPIEAVLKTPHRRMQIVKGVMGGVYTAFWAFYVRSGVNIEH